MNDSQELSYPLHQLRRRSLVITALALFFLSVASQAKAQDVVDYFKRNCVNCHTIGGGRLTGPDLKDVSQRQEREWLVRFMSDPKGMLSRGDPYAVKLKQESRDVVMPTLPGLTHELANALLDLIDAESLLEESQFVGLQMTDAPFTPEDIDLGRDYFTGRVELLNGGAACISCHTVNGLGGLSGGRLGPDLTLIFERLQGRRPLASWLLAPATTTMQPLFDRRSLHQHEILSLVAFFEHTAREGEAENSTAALTFLLISLGGAVFVLVILDVLWRRRFRAVRRPQVEESSKLPTLTEDITQ